MKRYDSTLYRELLGFFRGFGDSRHEIVGEVLLPYAPRMPLQGGFLIVGLEEQSGESCGVLGRIVRAFPMGDLNSGAGEEYLVDLARMKMSIPEEVREGRLRYRISLRLLGQVSRRQDGSVDFTPSIRLMPHLGAPVGLPHDDVLTVIGKGRTSSDPGGAAVIGHLSVGDLVFDGGERAKGRKIPVEFSTDLLLGRRTAVFARAGMGKSNFVKVLMSRLYQSQPDCATIIVDPEGEYAFSTHEEPGLLDQPGLRDRVVVFTDRADYDPSYERNVLGNTSVNFAELDPVDFVRDLLPDSKQETNYANLLRSLKKDAWGRLIALLHGNQYRTSDDEIAKVTGRQPQKFGFGEKGDPTLPAIKNNLVPPILRLHSADSRLIRQVIEAVQKRKIIILDLSFRSSADAKVIVSWILSTIFRQNQKAFTNIAPRHAHPQGQPAHKDPAKQMWPCLVVLEEAQFYLGSTSLREDSTFVRWYKEGRKYRLGSILVTQQPGAIDTELISQSDNFFVFHLLSQADLDALARANLHYAGDIATCIGNEPIPGNCFLWSGRGLSFVTCARILSFREVAGEAKNRLAEVKPVQLDIRPNVSVPMVEFKAGTTDAKALLEEIAREMIERNPKVWLYPVASGPLCASRPDTAGEEYYAVVQSFLTRHCEDEIAKRITAKRVSLPEIANVLVKSMKAQDSVSLIPTALEEALVKSGMSPSFLRAINTADRPVYLLHKSALDLSQKPDIRKACEIKEVST